MMIRPVNCPRCEQVTEVVTRTGKLIDIKESSPPANVTCSLCDHDFTINIDSRERYGEVFDINGEMEDTLTKINFETWTSTVITSKILVRKGAEINLTLMNNAEYSHAIKGERALHEGLYEHISDYSEDTTVVSEGEYVLVIFSQDKNWQFKIDFELSAKSIPIE